MLKKIIHCPCAEVESVALLCPHHHLPAPGVPHVTIPIVTGPVICLVHRLAIDVEEEDVAVPCPDSVLHTEGDPP